MNSKGIDCLGDNGVCIPISTHSVKTVKKQTYADKIRSMSDEELAEFLSETELHGSQGNYEDYLKLLQSEAE